MQADNFDKFNMTRLWLLVRREMLMFTFWEYFIIFIMLFLYISFILWLEGDIENLSGDVFHPFLIFHIVPLIIYIGSLGNFYSGIRSPNGLKILAHPFPRGMLPVRITEKLIAEFICFAILFPLVIQIISFLPFLIFRVDFSIWHKTAVVFFAICSPLIALKFLRIAIVENTSLRKYHDAIPFLGETIEWLIMGSIFGLSLYVDVLPLHYLAIAAAIITVRLWWATYRIRLKNASR